MVTAIEFDDEGNIVTHQPKVANVRFPTQEEQDAGMTEVPRSIRIKEEVKAIRGN